MEDTAIKAEPADDVRSPRVKEEPPEDTARSPGAATSVKEELDIEPTVFQRLDIYYNIPPCKPEPDETQPPGDSPPEELRAEGFVRRRPSDSSTSHFDGNFVPPLHKKISNSATQQGIRDRYFCNICDTDFDGEAHVLRHMLTHTKQNPPSCCICWRGFARDESLSRHMLMHTKQKPYCCEVCSKRYCQKKSLSLHMSVHAQPEPISREVFSKDFAREEFHAKQKPYHCDTCTMIFARKGDLSRHVLIHTRRLKY